MGSIKEQITKIVDTDSTNIGASVTQRGSKGAQSIEIINPDGDQLNLAAGLVPENFDYISLSYDSSVNLTGVVYKTGGSGGTTVATLTLEYDSSNNLTSVTKT